MKLLIAMTLILSSLSSLLNADTGVRGTEQDPRLRAAYFNARTHRSFDALSEVALVAKNHRGSFAVSADMVQAFKSAASDMGLNLADIGIPLTDSSVQDISQSAIYEHYNLGIALLNTATPYDGVKVLSAISTSEFVNNDELLLQDKTNLTLGYYFLETGDNAGAINYFRQVRRLSIYANKALVGLGWALLSPNTGLIIDDGTAVSDRAGLEAKDYLWSGSDDDIAWSRREAPFRRAWAVAKGEKERDLRAAVVPWMELISRDPLDPAVQEVMLVLPYLMLHWDGQEARAQQYYVSAVGRLKQAIADLAVIEKDVRSGGLIKSINDADANESNGWEIWLSDLTANRMGGYLTLLLDMPDFRDVLAEYRQFNRIYLRVHSAVDVASNNQRAGSGSAVDASELSHILAELARSRSHWAAVLEKLALERIVERRNRTEAYSAEAEFALARNYEKLRLQLSGFVWSENES